MQRKGRTNQKKEEKKKSKKRSRLWSLMRVKSVQKVLVESSTDCSRLVKFHSRSKRFGRTVRQEFATTLT